MRKRIKTLQPILVSIVILTTSQGLGSEFFPDSDDDFPSQKQAVTRVDAQQKFNKNIDFLKSEQSTPVDGLNPELAEQIEQIELFADFIVLWGKNQVFHEHEDRSNAQEIAGILQQAQENLFLRCRQDAIRIIESSKENIIKFRMVSAFFDCADR